MGNFLEGIQYPLLAGAGAILGLVFGAPLVALAAVFFPALWGWVLAPVAIGAVVGLVLAAFLR